MVVVVGVVVVGVVVVGVVVVVVGVVVSVPKRVLGPVVVTVRMDRF